MGFECFGKESDALVNSILDRSITEFVSDTITTVGINAFDSCRNLTDVTLKKCILLKNNAFCDCTALDSVHMPVLLEVGLHTFNRCTSLKKISLPCLKNMNTQSFVNCAKLVTVILSGNDVVVLKDSTAFDNTPISSGTGYIYVPAALIEEYKTATNWVTYADQLRAIEDYPDICGGA